MSAVAVLSLPAMAMMAVLGPDLGELLFHQEGVGEYLVPLAAGMAMSCFSSVFCCVLNGVSCQRTVAVISLLGGGVQLLCTLALVPLPGVGLGGYVAGTVLSTGMELSLLVYAVWRKTGVAPRLFSWLAAPGLGALLAALTGNLLLRRLREAGMETVPGLLCVLVFSAVLYLAALWAQGIRPREVLRVRVR